LNGGGSAGVNVYGTVVGNSVATNGTNHVELDTDASSNTPTASDEMDCEIQEVTVLQTRVVQ
jgi:hypothetical protein